MSIINTILQRSIVRSTRKLEIHFDGNAVSQDLSLIIQAATRVPSKHAKTRRMPRLAAYLLGVAIALVCCSQSTSLQTAADTSTSTLKNRIPPADPAKYRFIADNQQWRNPYLIVQAKGIDPWSMNPAATSGSG